MKAKTIVQPVPVLSSDLDLLKPKKFRDRSTHEKRTKAKLKEEERAHPVHEPYHRERKDWLTYEEEDNDEVQ